ncbi:MAG: HAD family hydrolase [Nitrososphaerota archaeon]|nr:HAD family hydrolase [Nitrososphaerota archaeon]
MIRGVAFDLDGTLIDSGATLALAWEAAFKKYDVIINKEEFAKYIGLDPRDIVRKFIPNANELDIKNMQRIRYEQFIRNIAAVKLYPEVGGVLSYLLNKGIKMSIATSMGTDLLDSVVRQVGLDKFMSYCVSSSQVKNAKPAPDVFLKAMKLMKVGPADCFVVGDREYDIIAGKRAGSRTVLVLRDRYSLSAGVNADYNIRDLSELVTII